MERILAGVETEYGLYVEGRGAEEQVDDATALVRSYPGERFVGWDYRHESPRADLRGFAVDRLQVDPIDARYDRGRTYAPPHEIRADRILPNGARLYNDHGHPEYATPECWSLDSLADHDKAGEMAVLRAAREFEAQTGASVRIYKNNTDFHGASYGTHESYLVPRALGFERLYQAVMPMLVVRQILCGAGKVGSDQGPSCAYQLSQRADFFVEPFNLETLYRRPVFNTRDEPHADPERWIRLHVISGDANMIRSATRRKVGLVKLALILAQAGEAPIWPLRDPVRAFQTISRDESYEFRLELDRASWTTAYQVLESYFSAAEATLGLSGAAYPEGSSEAEYQALIRECRELMIALKECPERFAYAVDWAAKKRLLEQFMEEEGESWSSPALRSYDLEYHNIDPEEGLFAALGEMGQTDADPPPERLEALLQNMDEPTRAKARGIAVRKFSEEIATACWRSVTFKTGSQLVELELPPDREYGTQLEDAETVEQFIDAIRGNL
jgi:Pup amidohydrolase